MAQTHQFQAEIKQLLDLMIHSLYSNREIFLRELVSNASDALDKLKFTSLTHENLTLPSELRVSLIPDTENKTLKIMDNGIGMTHEEVIENIGTIARSGTKLFQEAQKNQMSKPDLIGQFGVGFYSAFMVAEKVSLHTQKAGSNEGVLWTSQGDGSYTIENIARAEGAGTTITLHLRQFNEDEEVQDFASEHVLRSLIKKYSDFISYPIYLKTADKEEVLNSQKALWLRSPSDIKEEEYTEFYHHIAHDWNTPLKHIHYKAEGTMEFSALMYIPSKKPWNYYFKDFTYGLNLYIKRVFIMNDCEDLLPPYLRFMKGVVDSADLSLNVSREMLQQDRQVSQIRKSLLNKTLSFLKDLLTKERETYENFWTEFGTTLKEGIPHDFTNKEKLQDLLLFHTTQSDKLTTLDEYVSRMKEGQTQIYFLAGSSLDQMNSSPYMEAVKAKGYEVLLLIDPVDEWVTDSLREYKGKKLQSITKEDLDLESPEEKQAKAEESKAVATRFQPLIDVIKKTLEEDIKDVRVSDRLVQTPVCLVSGAQDPSANMEKILSQFNKDAKVNSKKILEINPKHPLFEKMLSAEPEVQKKWAEILYYQALLNEGTVPPDPAKFFQHVNELMLNSASENMTKH